MGARVPMLAATSARRSSSAAGFHVEAADAGVQGEAHLGGGLADAGEDHLASIAAGGQHAGQFAAGDDVEAGAQLGEYRQHAKAGVGLDRVAHQRLAQAEGALVGVEAWVSAARE